MLRLKIDADVGNGSAHAVSGFPDRACKAADKSELREAVLDVGFAADREAFRTMYAGAPDFSEHKKSSLPEPAGKENWKCVFIIAPAVMSRNDRFDLILGMNYTILNVQRYHCRSMVCGRKNAPKQRRWNGGHDKKHDRIRSVGDSL